MQRHTIFDVRITVKIYVKFFWVLTPVSKVFDSVVYATAASSFIAQKSSTEMFVTICKIKRCSKSKYVHIGISIGCSPNLSVALCQLFSTFIHIRSVYDRPDSITTTKGLSFNPHQELKQGRPIFPVIDAPLLLLR